MNLRADKCLTPSGVVVDPYYVQQPMDWVHIVAFDSSYKILLNEQYRHGAAKISIELPCGAIEPGEKPLEAITRELMEETGCTFDRIEELPPISPNPARYSNMIYPFVAFDTKVVADQNLDESEDISFKFVPLAKVMELIRTGKFLQSLHVSSLLLALDKARLIEIKY